MKKNANGKRKEGAGFVRGSGNVFADLGLPDSDELIAKADLMHAISQEIKRRGLTQTAAAGLLGLGQSDISRISRGRMDYFSQERLIDILRKLGNNVEIVLSHGRGKMDVWQCAS